MSTEAVPEGPTTPAAAASPVARTGIDPAALMRIKNLQLRAKTVVEGFYNGLHRSPFHGFSAEFSEYRPYTTGDDPRGLDWKLFARSDRFYIKRFEDETSRRCYFLVDQSLSMAFGSLGYTKAEYAKTVTATLAYFLSRQRDSVGLMTFDAGIADYLPSRHRPGHLHQLMLCLERATTGRGTDLQLPLDRIAAMVKKRGMMVLVSDLMVPLEGMRRRLGYLRSRGHEVILLRTLDPAEIDLQIESAGMVEDLETGREVYIDPEQARAQYSDRFAAHEQAIKAICDDLGIDFFRLATDQPIDRALFDLINAQMRRGRKVMRHPATPGGSP